MKLPKCKECGHQFVWKEIIKSQWRYGFKAIQCKICDTKFAIKNSFLLYLLLFMGPTLISQLVLKKYFIPKDLSLTPLSFIIELPPLIIMMMMISLIIPYFVKLGTPIKE